MHAAKTIFPEACKHFPRGLQKQSAEKSELEDLTSHRLRALFLERTTRYLLSLVSSYLDEHKENTVSVVSIIGELEIKNMLLWSSLLCTPFGNVESAPHHRDCHLHETYYCRKLRQCYAMPKQLTGENPCFFLVCFYETKALHSPYIALAVEMSWPSTKGQSFFHSCAHGVPARP